MGMAGAGFAEALLAPLPATLQVYGIIGGAFLLRRLGRVPEDVTGVLQRLLIDVLFPAFLIANLLGRDDVDELGELALPPVLGFLITTGGFLLAYGLATRLPAVLGLATPQARRAFAVAVGMANYGYLPIPLVGELAEAGMVPPATLQALLVHNVGVDVAMWSVGVLVVSGHFERDWWRHLLNAPLITIVVVLTLNLLGVSGEMPGIAAGLKAADFLGAAAIPVALLMTGIVIAEVWDQADFRGGLRTILGGATLRLGVLPVIVLAVVYLLPPGQQPLRATLAVQASMPAALFPIVLSRIYGADPATAVRVSVSTALLAFVTIPLWLAFGLWLIKS